MSILIKNVLHESRTVDILIEGNRISRIAPGIAERADTIVDGTNKAILPSFFNAHTHSAMTLLRGYADDMELHRWLNEYIWPLEAKLSEEDIYCGARLAALEMIKSGTTFFNDMYWHWHGTARAAESMGMRAEVAAVFIDFGNDNVARQQMKVNRQLLEESRDYSDRISFALGPHAIYTVGADSLRWCRDFAEEHDLSIHLHVSETRKEVDDCLAAHGMRPVEYLESLGILSPRLIACHAVWCDEREIALLSERGVKVVHNPVSNMKLCSGTFPYKAMASILVALGTDGCSSNNNLDMLEEMKFAAVYAKATSGDPGIWPATKAFSAATINGARAFGIDAGEIAEGRLADCILVDLDHPQMTPCYNLISNMVYSSHGDVVDTTICDGKILMQNRRVEQEEEILAAARQIARKLARN